MTTMTIPSGFARVDQHQLAEFQESGFITGASKVTVVDGEVFARLRPPRSIEDVRSNLGRRHSLMFGAGAPLAYYVTQYNRGWAAARRGSDTEFASGYTNFAYDDGYLDAVAGRMKWHLTYCADHDTCGEG